MTRFDPGPMLLFGFEGTTPDDALARARATGGLGVILFSRNCASKDQLRDLLQGLQGGWPAGPPLVSIDHEGPRVHRLRGIARAPTSARELGELDDPDHTVAEAAAAGRALAALGIHLSFAPVLDLEVHPDHPALRGRCYGSDPERVARHGAAVVEGLHAAGVAACAKHFPGHGSAPLDSHTSLPTSPRSLDELRAQDLVPYEAAVRTGVDMVMTAHVLYPAIADLPATCAPRLLGEILRGALGFQGVCASDDCDMVGFRALGPIRESVARAALAGCDLFLCCRDPEVLHEAHAGLADLYRTGSAARARLDEARLRCLSLRSRALERRHGAGAHP